MNLVISNALLGLTAGCLAHEKKTSDNIEAKDCIMDLERFYIDSIARTMTEKLAKVILWQTKRLKRERVFHKVYLLSSEAQVQTAGLPSFWLAIFKYRRISAVSGFSSLSADAVVKN